MKRISENNPIFQKHLFCGMHIPDDGNRSHMQIACRALGDIIQQELTERQREILLLYYYEEKNTVEIAAELGLNKSTVSRTLCRAKERIRKNMRFYFDYTSFQLKD